MASELHFFNLGEVPGKLQPLCGGGGVWSLLASGLLARGIPIASAGSTPQVASLVGASWLRLFIFGCLYPRGEERHGGFRLMLVVVRTEGDSAGGERFLGAIGFWKSGFEIHRWMSGQTLKI